MLGCVLVAAKWHDDDWERDNSFFAAVAGYPLSVVNSVERAVLSLLEFRLFKSVEQLDGMAERMFRVLRETDDGDACDDGAEVIVQRLIALGVVDCDEYENDNEESDDEDDGDGLFSSSAARHQQQQKWMQVHDNDSRSWSAISCPSMSVDFIPYESSSNHMKSHTHLYAQSGLYHQHHKEEAVVMHMPSHAHHHQHSPAVSELSDCLDHHHHHQHVHSRQYALDLQCRATDVLYCDDNFIL